MPSIDVQDANPESRENLYDVIAIAAALGQLVAFTVVGFTALDSLVYGAVAGAMTGLGSYLFLPWFLRLSAASDDEDDTSFADIVGTVPGDPSRAVFGLGLDSGGVVMIAAGFVTAEPTLLVGAGTGTAWALVVYLVGSLYLDRSVSSTA